MLGQYCLHQKLLFAVGPRQIKIHDLRAHDIDALKYNVAMQYWNLVLQCDDIESSYETVLSIIKDLIT